MHCYRHGCRPPPRLPPRCYHPHRTTTCRLSRPTLNPTHHRAAPHSSLEKIYSKLAAKGKLTEDEAAAQKSDALSKVVYSTEIEALADCDLVIEAIIEDVGIKLPFYENLGKTVKPGAIFASNTSSLSIGIMAEASGRADRFVGLHFFNPVQLMKLTEVIRTDDTDPKVGGCWC